MNRIVLRNFMVCLLTIISFHVISGQTLSLQSYPSNNIQFDFTFEKPFYQSNINATTLSGVYQVTAKIPVSSKLNVMGNFPFVINNYTEDYGYSKYSVDQKGLGNIFIGLQTNPEMINNRRSVVTFGLYLPTADEQVSLAGLFINYYDFQKYVPNTLGLYFNYAYYKTSEEGFCFGFEAGPNIIIPTKDKNLETQVYMHYGFSTGFRANKLLLNAEILGIALLTQQIDNFGDRKIHMLNVGAQWNEAKISPKIFYKIYLKEGLSDLISGVLGIGVSVSID